MDGRLATVSGTTVTGVSEGTAVLTATWRDLSTSLHVEVKPPNRWRGKDLCEAARHAESETKGMKPDSRATTTFADVLAEWQQGNEDAADVAPCIRSYRWLASFNAATEREDKVAVERMLAAEEPRQDNVSRGKYDIFPASVAADIQTCGTLLERCKD